MAEAGVLVLTPWLLQCQSWALGKDEDLAALNQDWEGGRCVQDPKRIPVGDNGVLFWFYVTT
jgi:hypothetical protein